MPSPLQFALANSCEPSKEEGRPWWTKAAFDAYFRDCAPDDAMTHLHSDLFCGEWNTGIGIDPVTQTQDGERIYSAEYLRLRPGIRLGFDATLPVKRNGFHKDVQECIARLLSKDRAIIVGGQQRTCSVEALDQSQTLASVLPLGAVIQDTRVKWVLLSPAVFPAIDASERDGTRINPHQGGWLPNWIEPVSGKVELLDGPGKEKARRLKVQPGKMIAARLVAARIPKPIALTGWTEAVHLKDTPLAREHGPKPTLLAVPAGAVYYFEADTPEDASKLAAALNWHGSEANPTIIKNRRSTLLGEKGFGLGVCGTWNFYEAAFRAKP